MADPVYTYTPDTPKGPQAMNNSQTEILANFQAINELINVNHVGFNTPNDTGKHKFCQMSNQDEDPETNSDEIVMYVKETPDGDHDSEIFIRYEDSGESIKITDIPVSLIPNSGISNTLVFPSGFVICTGQVPSSLSPVSYLDSIGGSTNPPFKYSPMVKIVYKGSTSGGAFSSVGSYNNTQTHFSYNASTTAGNKNFVSFGF